jgi:hypothetical protein
VTHFGGIDYDSSGVFVAIVDEEAGAFCGVVSYEIDCGPGGALQRVRRLRDLMPPRSAWRDSGVLAVGLESTFSQAYKAAVALARVQGAIIACLPRDVELELLTANGRAEPGWKLLTTGKTTSSKDEVKAWAIENGAPPGLVQDFYDAFAIARATRELWLTRRREAA